jgi:anti-sigma regulatory factor (Ser/Thr protein kinase)
MSGDKRSTPELPATPDVSGPLRFQMRISSDPRLLAVVRCTVSEFAAIRGFPDDQCQSIALAVDEAHSNIIRHAYKNRCDQEIEIGFRAEGDCLEFTLVDRGEPIDRSKYCAQPLDGIALGGRGTHLIRQIMDEVCYERTSEENRLRLKKYLAAGKSKG